MPDTPIPPDEKDTMKLVMLNIYERVKNYPVFMMRNQKKSVEPSIPIANQLTEPEAIQFMRDREEEVPRDLSDSEKLSLMQFSTLGILYQFILHTKKITIADGTKHEQGDLIFFVKGTKVLTLSFDTLDGTEATENSFTVGFYAPGEWTDAMTKLLERLVAFESANQAQV